MSYGIRSGVNDRFAQRKEFYDELAQGDIRQQVAEACPEPNPKILARLQKDWERGPDFSLRLPWQSRSFDKYNEGYDEQNVLFFARVLTMLAELGVLAPAQLEAQGGSFSKGGGGVVPTNFDGPTMITPGETVSRSYFNVATTEDEVKRNALSNSSGGLADASRRQLPEVISQGRNQVRYLMDRFLQKMNRKLRREEEPPPIFTVDDGWEDIDWDALDES